MIICSLNCGHWKAVLETGTLITVFHVLISRKMKSSVHSEEDDFVPELHRNVHPRERPDWEETLSAMVNQFYAYVCMFILLT